MLDGGKDSMTPSGNDLTGLMRLDKLHVKPATEVLVKAFMKYPFIQYYFPDELKREKVARYFLSSGVYTGIRYGEAYATSPNLEGIAIWLLSDNYPISFINMLRAVPLSAIFGLGRLGGFKMRRIGEHVDAVHRRLAPFKHWFLEIIGVDPEFQGKGYAGKLLSPMLSRIDEEGLPCYLDTEKEANVRLYEHFGFEVIDKSDIPGTDLTCWAMLRGKPDTTSS